MMWLKKYLGDYVKAPVEITRPKPRFGDYSTNVLFKSQFKADEIMAYLLQHELIEDVKLVKGYLNIFVSDELRTYDGELSSNYLRIEMVHNRLEIEGYQMGSISDEWKPLSKKINEINHALDNGFEYDKEDVIKTFEAIDRGYVYRSKSDETLGGIYQLLNQLLILLGRIDNENNL